jgi:hypothetical protein
MKEEELKQRAMKHRRIPEWSWAYLREEEKVDDALRQGLDEEMVEYIIKKFDRLAAGSPERTRRKHIVDEDRNAVPVSLSESEQQRKAAFEEYAAFRAARAGGTRQFRNRVLGDCLLTAEQARDLVRSPAARFLEENTFEFAGGDIPLVGHRATLEGYERGERSKDWDVQHRATVSVDPPGMTETVEKIFDEASQLAPNRPRFKDRTYGQALYFVNERGRPRKVSVWDRSLLERLRSMSEGLAQEYRWEPAESTMFLLTGKIPAVPPLKVTSSQRFLVDILDATTSVPRHIDATITITASPWVPTSTVTSNYRKAQIEVLGSSGGKPPSEKNLTLFRFVIERIQSLSEPAAEAIASRAPGHVRMPEGRELVREWNETHPKWVYKTSVGDLNTRLFWRDFKRILKTIAVGPPYRTGRAANNRRYR